MQVRNYYAFEEAELDKAIADMREWLWRYQKHELVGKVRFALHVALNAKEILPIRKVDQFVQTVIDILCNY